MTNLAPLASRSSGTYDRGRAYDVLSLVIVGATCVVTAAVYPRLPPRMPVHFDLHGVADGFAPKGAGAWLVPATTLGLFALIKLGARLLPRPWRERTATSAASLLLLIVTVGLTALHFLMLHVALTGAVGMGASLGVVLGALWVGLGLVMPRLRRNPWMGVRTPWTLTSDENWARTHRVAGASMAIGGLVAIAAAALGSAAVPIVAVVASALVPLAYSLLLARHLDHR